MSSGQHVVGLHRGKKKKAKKVETNRMCRRTKGGTGNLLGLKRCSNGCTVLIVEVYDGGGALYMSSTDQYDVGTRKVYLHFE